MCVKLAYLPSKNTHHKQIDRPDRRCTNDNIVAGTWDQDKNQYAGGPQDHLKSGNTISPLLVWVGHAAAAGVWSTNMYLKYKFEPADGISIKIIPIYNICMVQERETSPPGRMTPGRHWIRGKWGGDIEPPPKKEIDFEDILSRMFFGQVILIIYI